jgi:hypothetical protein
MVGIWNQKLMVSAKGADVLLLTDVLRLAVIGRQSFVMFADMLRVINLVNQCLAAPERN